MPGNDAMGEEQRAPQARSTDPGGQGAPFGELRVAMSKAMEHEMYSSLGALLGMLEVLSINAEQPLSPPQKQLVDEALRIGDGLRARIEALVVLFSDADDPSRAPRDFQARRLVDHAVRAASWTAREKEVTLRLPETGPWEREVLYIDASRVDRALRGMTDAMLATVPMGGSVSLHVEVLPEQLRFELRAESPVAPPPELAVSHVLHAGWMHLISLQRGSLQIEPCPARIVLELPRSTREGR